MIKANPDFRFLEGVNHHLGNEHRPGCLGYIGDELSYSVMWGFL